jgi:hypothetical protein
MSETDDLRLELTRLRTAVAKKLREKLEGADPVTPAYLDVARRFLSDQGYKLRPELPERAGPVISGLPFTEGDE